MTKRILCQMGCALVGAVMVGFLFAAVLNGAVSATLGGDKGGVFVALFLGLPIGSLLGILFIDRVLYNFMKKNVVGVVLGFILSSLGAVESLILLDTIGGTGILFAPGISTCLGMAGYWIPLARSKGIKR